MSTTKKQLLTGGAGSACAMPSTNLSKYMYRSCLDENLHNRNPVADFSLMEGAGALPTMTGGSGITMGKIKKYSRRKMYAQMPLSMTKTKQKKKVGMTGGGCPTSARPPITFREYLENAAETIRGKPVLTGGSGYVVNPGMGIAGLPEILKYDSCCPPAMLGKSIVMDPVGSTCGPLAQTGGSAGSGQAPVDSIEYSANKISANSKSTQNMPSAKSSKRHSKGKGKRHTKKSQKGRKSTMRGGAPANYPESLSGEPGDFRYQGDDLTYGGRQPFWSTKDR